MQIKNLRDAGLPPLPILFSEPGERAFASLCRKNGIDVVGPLSTPPSASFPIPAIGYIYDFQHRYFPGYFKKKELEARDIKFRAILERCGAVVVNSRSVKADAEHFFPGGASHIVSLPFSASPNPDWFVADPSEVSHRYGIGRQYFIVSNQLWVHKRHEVAIEAFSRAAVGNDSVELVLTGSTEDYRVPGRIHEIRSLINRLGVDRRIHILGRIPKVDQIALVRGSVGMIQPTAFEGGPGGGSVFDAVALGVPAIVSDLAVNREISGDIAAYFPLDDVEELAKQMRRLLGIRATHIAPDELLRAGRERRHKQGRAIWQAANLALSRVPGAQGAPK